MLGTRSNFFPSEFDLFMRHWCHFQFENLFVSAEARPQLRRRGQVLLVAAKETKLKTFCWCSFEAQALLSHFFSKVKLNRVALWQPQVAAAENCWNLWKLEGLHYRGKKAHNRRSLGSGELGSSAFTLPPHCLVFYMELTDSVTVQQPNACMHASVQFFFLISF